MGFLKWAADAKVVPEDNPDIDRFLQDMKDIGLIYTAITAIVDPAAWCSFPQVVQRAFQEGLADATAHQLARIDHWSFPYPMMEVSTNTAPITVRDYTAGPFGLQMLSSFGPYHGDFHVEIEELGAYLAHGPGSVIAANRWALSFTVGCPDKAHIGIWKSCQYSLYCRTGLGIQAGQVPMESKNLVYGPPSFNLCESKQMISSMYTPQCI